MIFSGYAPPERLEQAVVEALQSLLIGAAGAVLLALLYSALRTDWPDTYSTAKSSLASSSRSSPVKYLGFRLAPMFVIALLVARTAEDLKVSSGIAVATVIATHLGATNGRALIGLARGQRRNRRLLLLLFHLLSGLLVLAAGLLGWAARGRLAPLVPEPQELVFALWTGAFVAIVGVALRRVAEFDDAGERYDVAAVEKEVGPELWQYVTEAAARNQCDPDVLKSVLAVEVLQRPRWLRRLEYAKGRVLKKGSYGVAQISADAPISDRESIDRLAATFRGYFPARSSRYGTVRARSLAARMAQHNPDPEFCTEASLWYQILSPGAISASRAVSADGRPLIEVREVEPLDGSLRLSGTTSVEGNLLSHAYVMDDEVPHGGDISLAETTPGRRTWELLLPEEAVRVTIREPAAPGRDEDDRRTVTVDLELYA